MAQHLDHNMKVYGEIKLYAGTGSPELAQKISDYLKSPLCERDVIEFPNENLFVKLHSSVRGQDVYVIQQTASNVHRNLTTKCHQLFGIARRLQRNQHTDLAHAVGDGVVNVSGDHARIDGQASGAAEAHVLADLADHFGDLLVNRLARARIFRRAYFGFITANAKRDVGNVFHHCLEDVVPRNEVGFRVHFDNGFDDST